MLYIIQAVKKCFKIMQIAFIISAFLFIYDIKEKLDFSSYGLVLDKEAQLHYWQMVIYDAVRCSVTHKLHFWYC